MDFQVKRADVFFAAFLQASDPWWKPCMYPTLLGWLDEPTYFELSSCNVVNVKRHALRTLVLCFALHVDMYVYIIYAHTLYISIYIYIPFKYTVHTVYLASIYIIIGKSVCKFKYKCFGCVTTAHHHFCWSLPVKKMHPNADLNFSSIWSYIFCSVNSDTP